MNTSAFPTVAESPQRIRRSGMDRRAGEDRRQIHDLGCFENGGIERRSGMERRELSEQRSGWIRVTQWSSVYVGDQAVV